MQFFWYKPYNFTPKVCFIFNGVRAKECFWKRIAESLGHVSWVWNEKEFVNDRHWPKRILLFFGYIPLASLPLIYIFFSTHNAKTATLRYIYVFVGFTLVHILQNAHKLTVMTRKSDLKSTWNPKNETYINSIGKLQQPAFDYVCNMLRMCLYVCHPNMKISKQELRPGKTCITLAITVLCAWPWLDDTRIYFHVKLNYTWKAFVKYLTL